MNTTSKTAKVNREDNGQYVKYNQCEICNTRMAPYTEYFHQDYKCAAGHDDFPGEYGMVCEDCLTSTCKAEV